MIYTLSLSGGDEEIEPVPRNDRYEIRGRRLSPLENRSIPIAPINFENREARLDLAPGPRKAPGTGQRIYRVKAERDEACIHETQRSAAEYRRPVAKAKGETVPSASTVHVERAAKRARLTKRLISRYRSADRDT